MNWNQLLPYLGPALVVAIIARRMLRTQKPKRVRTNLLWIQPAILFAAMASLFATTPVQISPLSIGLFAVAVLAGGAFGYFRALHQQFSIEPETGNVMSQATPLGSILFLGLFLIRFGMNKWMDVGQPSPTGKLPSAKVLLYTDAMLVFAFAMVALTAFEVWRRTRPIVAEHKAGAPTLPLP